MLELRTKMSKVIIAAMFCSLALVIGVNPALAHVSVKPAEVGVGAYQNFAVSVPNERETSTVGVRLVIPEGLESVMPNVKPGWIIETKHPVDADSNSESEDHHEAVTEIVWTGGTVPVGQRDEFVFSAKTPAEETTLTWKAYQTYSDGTVVAWELGKNDVQPKDKDGKADYSKFGPASHTIVIDDLAISDEPSSTPSESTGNSDSLPILLSVLALGLSGYTLVRQSTKKAA
jgi:uncharacterized protein YcnI